MKRLLVLCFLLCTTYMFSVDLIKKNGLYYEAGLSIPYTGETTFYELGYRVSSYENGELKNYKIYDTPDRKYLKEEIIYKKGEKYESTSYYKKGNDISSHSIWETDKFNT